MSAIHDQLLNGGDCDVPREVAICPECSATLHVYALGYDTDTGIPIQQDLELECTNDPCCEFRCNQHEYKQSDWQPVRDAIVKWCGAIEG